MIERLKFLKAELESREAQVTGDYKALYGDRAQSVGNWIEDMERGWPVDTDYIGSCATEFEKMCGLAS